MEFTQGENGAIDSVEVSVLRSKMKVLFLCTGNSCRSQMAEGWARVLANDVIEPYSAGTSPGRIDPRAVRVMNEAGIDISDRRPKPLRALENFELDWVVTVCDHANETCPVFPGPVKRLHVGFDDPPRLAAQAKTEDEALGHYRRVRDEIRSFIRSLPARLEKEAR